MPKFIAMNDESDALKLLLEQNNANVVVKLDGANIIRFSARNMELEVLTGPVTAKGLTVKLVDPQPAPGPAPAPAPAPAEAPAPAPAPAPQS